MDGEAWVASPPVITGVDGHKMNASGLVLAISTMFVMFTGAADVTSSAVANSNNAVAVTQVEKAFLDKVANLAAGASREMVLRTLGKPNEATSGTLFYKVRESDREGGHYMTAFLEFGTNGLLRATLGYGHETLVNKTQ